MRYSADRKRRRSERCERKNFFESVVDIFINEKSNTLKANDRDRRKNKNRDLEMAKYKYNSYLNSYARENRVKRNRLAREKQPVENRRELPLADF